MLFFTPWDSKVKKEPILNGDKIKTLFLRRKIDPKVVDDFTLIRFDQFQQLVFFKLEKRVEGKLEREWEVTEKS